MSDSARSSTPSVVDVRRGMIVEFLRDCSRHARGDGGMGGDLYSMGADLIEAQEAQLAEYRRREDLAEGINNVTKTHYEESLEAQLAALERAAIPALLWIEGAMKSGLQSCEEAARSSGQNIEQHSSFCTMEQDARSLKEALAARSTSPDKDTTATERSKA